MTVRDSMNFAGVSRTSFGARGCKSQGVLRALNLAVVFTALVSTPCLPEDTNSAGTNPVASVSMDHNTFTPSEITVAPGTTVTWVNNETMPHTVVAPSQGFRSKTFVKDAKFSFTFTTPGDYDYLCSIHPNMKGKVNVKPGAG